MQYLLIFVLSYKDFAKRKGVPSGVLVFHGGTKNPLALSESPLSDLMMRVYKDGTQFALPDSLGDGVSHKILPKNLSSFEKTAATYFDVAGLVLKRHSIKPPLRSEIKLDAHLNVVTEGEPNEVLPLKGANYV